MDKTRGDSNFYDQYHQKNQPFSGVIGENNFTYYYWLKILAKHLPTLSEITVLDVGCGVGSLSLYCASKGAYVTGIDISKRAIAIATNAASASTFAHTPTFYSQILTESLGTFDLIICSEVIEHVPDEKIFLKQLLANLKPNGLLILSTPNSENWLRRSGNLAKFDDSVGHVRLFNPNSLKALIAAYNTTLIDFQLTEGPMRMVLFSSMLGHLIRLIKGPLVPLFHMFDHSLTTIFGWHDQFVVLKKNG